MKWLNYFLCFINNNIVFNIIESSLFHFVFGFVLLKCKKKLVLDIKLTSSTIVL